MPKDIIYIECPQCGEIFSVNRFEENALCDECKLSWSIQDEDIISKDKYEKSIRNKIVREKVTLT